MINQETMLRGVCEFCKEPCLPIGIITYAMYAGDILLFTLTNVK